MQQPFVIVQINFVPMPQHVSLYMGASIAPSSQTCGPVCPTGFLTVPPAPAHLSAGYSQGPGPKGLLSHTPRGAARVRDKAPV